jgi:hypothetical protein
MYRTISRTALIAGTLVVLTTGCGRLIEEATEEAVERAVEADSGGDVEVEFNDDGLSVESDDGNVTFSADENGVEIEGTDADGNDFSLDADEDGINAQSEDGGSVDIDSDGSFTATDADGEISSGQVTSDGDSVTVEGDDGEAVFTSGAGIPEQWPDDVPQPEGLDDIFGTYISDDGVQNIAMTGTTGDSAVDAFDDYVDRLVDAGFEESSTMSQGNEFHSATFTRGDTTVSVTTQSNGDSTDVVIGIS